MAGQASDDLSDVYGAKTPEDARRIYDDWSQSYDADNLKKGFRLPSLGAAMLARHLGRGEGPILDAACGTGLVGETLAVLGYGAITGCDLSGRMVAAAKRTNAYETVMAANMAESLPFPADSFAAFTCIGAFGPGHAPPESLHELVRVTRPGGIGVFNLISATWEEQGFPAVIDALTAAGRWEQVQISAPFRPYLLGEPELWSRLHVMRML
ncbi:MAG: class I SAM-dependent DNA methyltransferase [Pseudomonadota bacterium]|uniref:class I SAM-dependent DNA methyltransferase n=1 Tax=Roseovarius TaxID=74030 RepID=UPI0022A834C9|nr:class I SAM-dependent methyltransferase [Roseovarius sp. EGI FJ00037]MCZ0813660.1 class I SAM-dependent methyltransferase [Roseovarius sp. EGI FJ00037]